MVRPGLFIVLLWLMLVLHRLLPSRQERAALMRAPEAGVRGEAIDRLPYNVSACVRRHGRPCFVCHAPSAFLELVNRGTQHSSCQEVGLPSKMPFPCVDIGLEAGRTLLAHDDLMSCIVAERLRQPHDR